MSMLWEEFMKYYCNLQYINRKTNRLVMPVLLGLRNSMLVNTHSHFVKHHLAFTSG